MQTAIILGDTDIHAAKVFAAKSVSTHIDQYARRRQTDPRQIQHQIEIGKLGEIATSCWLKTVFAEPVSDNPSPRALFGVSEPDFEIYDAHQKTFAPDLFLFVDGFGQIPIHVKTQDQQSAERFGESWTFQYGINVGSDKEIFAPDPQGYVAFVSVEGNRAHIRGIPLVATLHSHDLFRDPKLAKLRGIKTVVYFEDLERLPHDVLWAVINDFGATNI